MSGVPRAKNGIDSLASVWSKALRSPAGLSQPKKGCAKPLLRQKRWLARRRSSVT